MIQGLENLTKRASQLLSGGSVPVIEGTRIRPNLHGVGKPGEIHWKSIELITNRRTGGSRRSKLKLKNT